jgi:hypothetical protein
MVLALTFGNRRIYLINIQGTTSNLTLLSTHSPILSCCRIISPRAPFTHTPTPMSPLAVHGNEFTKEGWICGLFDVSKESFNVPRNRNLPAAVTLYTVSTLATSCIFPACSCWDNWRKQGEEQYLTSRWISSQRITAKKKKPTGYTTPKPIHPHMAPLHSQWLTNITRHWYWAWRSTALLRGVLDLYMRGVLAGGSVNDKAEANKIHNLFPYSACRYLIQQHRPSAAHFNTSQESSNILIIYVHTTVLNFFFQGYPYTQ